jgi:flagellar biosynthetic protein FlhB
VAQDDADEKTEQPTARRREEAREEGQIARSADLTAAVGLLAGLLLLKTFGGRMVGGLLDLIRALGNSPAVTSADLLPWIKKVSLAAAEIMLPFLALLLVITVAGTAAQSGLLLTWKRLTPKPDRVSPVTGVKRLFSADVLSRLGLGLLKMTCVAGIAYLTIVGRLGTVLSAGGLHAGGVFGLGAEVVFDLALRLAAVLLVLGIVDYLIQRWRLERQLRMTKQEVRDELKRMEGDPLIKQRRRQIQRRLAMQRIQAEVPRADVVVTNPTHYAVALRYDEAAMAAPRVVAKGKDFLAERIRQIAQQAGVPLVQRPPLARALYFGVEVGQEVPPAFYRAVAELLAFVYRLTGKKAG